ncbi:hypothetical protein RIF29_15293 [Crotalaria pallida]|uniref:Uncharacterized protein n=1 Tax=Crotalaria pallida TaxID=3830 RepID=A0AAN9FCW2_CROPI
MPSCYHCCADEMIEKTKVRVEVTTRATTANGIATPSGYRCFLSKTTIGGAMLPVENYHRRRPCQGRRGIGRSMKSLDP